jgi:hypothetical protein
MQVSNSEMQAPKGESVELMVPKALGGSKAYENPAVTESKGDPRLAHQKLAQMSEVQFGDQRQGDHSSMFLTRGLG